ncbi:uncharacterized protein LOC129598190 isoform X2 [Paramacrobiotus metropolitanus]|uniref:uncharacterized protein LOC129598190 isoform X2 n=1 Tax=Paramacrobiotus metropolitanus TaxID=2943436 RepID=UPI002445775B|nr:uncharacterized protein LOC129598190 isoform X2 [Paramacrobiotus metropolitanus]
MDEHNSLLKTAVVPLLIYVIVFLIYSFSTACPPAVTKACGNATCNYTIATLERIVQEATHNLTSDKIHLVFEPPAPSATRSLIQTVDVDSGASVSLPCTVHNVTYSIPQQLPDIFWTQKEHFTAILGSGRFTSSGALDVLHSVYSRPSLTAPYADVTVTLTVKNVAWKNSGDLVCSQMCRPPLEPWIANMPLCTGHNQHFRLRVFPSASELFPVPMANVSVRRGSDAHLTCVANVGEVASTPAFIWRFNGYVIYASNEHPLRILANAVDGRPGVSGEQHGDNAHQHAGRLPRGSAHVGARRVLGAAGCQSGGVAPADCLPRCCDYSRRLISWPNTQTLKRRK